MPNTRNVEDRSKVSDFMMHGRNEPPNMKIKTVCQISWGVDPTRNILHLPR